MLVEVVVEEPSECQMLLECLLLQLAVVWLLRKCTNLNHIFNCNAYCALKTSIKCCFKYTYDIHVLSRLLAMLEFLYGSYQKSKEMGTSWLEEMKEEMKFAMICHGNTKVTT